MKNSFNKMEMVFFFFSLFILSYLFSISPLSGAIDFEERTAGGFYEPIQVLDIEKRGYALIPIFNSPSDGYSYAKIKKIGPFEIIFQKFHPEIKIRVGSSTFMVSPVAHIGPLHLLWQRLWMKISSPSIYSARMSAVFLAIVLLIIFYYFVRYLKGNQACAILSVFYLILYPRLFSLKAYSVYNLFTYISFLAILFLIFKKKGSISLIAILSGIMLHFHILIGGALLISTFLSYAITYGLPKFSLKDVIRFSSLVILIAFLPILFYILFPAIGERVFYPQRFSISLHISLLGTALKSVFSLLFASPRVIEEPLFKKHFLLTFWRIIDALPGIILFLGLVGAIIKRRDKEAKFLLFVCLFYVSFGIIRLTRPHHYFPLVFILLLQFIITFPEIKNLKITLLAIPPFILLIDILIGTILFLSFSLPSLYTLKLHKEIGNYLLKEGIHHPYSLAGPFGYELLTGGKVRAIDFTPFLLTHPEKLEEVLLLAEGKYLLVMDGKEIKEKVKMSATLREVEWIAKSLSMEVKVIKRFPEGKEEAFSLIKVMRRKTF